MKVYRNKPPAKSSALWVVDCKNEYSGEDFQMEGLFDDKAVAAKVCEHLNACAKAGQETPPEDRCRANNLNETFYGVYKVHEVPVSKTAAEWRDKNWRLRKYLAKADAHPAVRALKAL